MSTLRQIEAIQAEVNYYRDRVALLRARLYRNGRGNTPRLEELQRKLQRSERQLSSARATLPRHPQP